MTDPVGTAKKLGEGVAQPFVEGAQKLADGKTFDGTAQITEAASDTILDLAAGGGKALIKVLAGGLPGVPGIIKKVDLPDVPDSLDYPDIQLQRKFKHASEFGVSGNYNSANAKFFSEAINKHLASPGVVKIEGTYRGDPVIHYLDPSTGLNVISDKSGKFISGFKLNPAQLENVKKRGSL